MRRHRRAYSSCGQSVVEFALVLPILIVLVMGVVEVSYALLDQHVVTRMTREGSNLISRDSSLQDAAAAMTSMSSRPVNFSTSSTVIFSVIKRGATVGSTNFNKDILYQRYQFGGFPAQSTVVTRGAGSFGGAPDYRAANSDTDANLQVTSLPSNLLTTGGMLYVTEIYTRHTLLTPLDRFGITLPTRLSSIAYF